MSLEAALAENTAAATALAEILKQVAVNQERLIAGQQTAIDKVEAPKATRATRKKAEPETEVAETPAAEESAPKVEEKPAKTETPSITTGEGVKKLALDWINEKAKGTPERQTRGDFVLELQKHFDVKLGELSDPDQIQEIVSLIQRKIAGEDVVLGSDEGEEEDFG